MAIPFSHNLGGLESIFKSTRALLPSFFSDNSIEPAHCSNFHSTLPDITVRTFTFQDLEGKIIKGSPDTGVLKEALARFKDARQALKGHAVDILEFPLSTNPHTATSRDIFIRYRRAEHTYEIKVFEFGHYNVRKLVGHFMLKENKPKSTYTMTIS